MTHDEAMYHLKRACNASRAAQAAGVRRAALVRALGEKPPEFKSDEIKAFLRPYLTDRFDEYFRRINKRTALSVVFWHQGKIKEGHHEVINSLNSVDIIGYYDYEVRVKDLMDDLIAYIYDTTGDSIV